MQKLLTNQDLAELMGWEVQTVHQRRYRGLSLPRSIEIGTGKAKTIRYRAEDVDAWLASHSTTGNDHDDPK